MKYATRFAMLLTAGLWALTAPQVFAGPGGHGGGGGHGSGGHGSGHGSGHSSHGSSGGHASGHATNSAAHHSIGTSIVHFFGGHAKSVRSQQPPSASSAPLDPKVAAQLKQSATFRTRFRPVHRRPGEAFVFGEPFICPRRNHFGFSGCSAFLFPGNGFFFGNGFNCFNNGAFFFDPFFFGLSSSSWYGWPAPYESAPIDSVETPLPVLPPEAEGADAKAPNAGLRNDAPDNVKHESPVTLLQLRDGSMYGLTRYWVEGDNLHYFTTYGGEGSVPIERIDFDQTLKLNADRGLDFVLRSKP